MHARRLLTLALITTSALVAVPAVASAKTVEFRGVVSGSPYGASNGYMAVPVLFSKQTAHNNHLKSPVGLLVVKRALRVAIPAGAPAILPVHMRAGDRFKGKVPMKSSYRQSFYPRITFSSVAVYFRSKELSTAELNDMIVKIRKDLDNLTSTVGSLTNYTVANFAAVRADIADLRAQLDALRNALSGVSSTLQTLQTQLDSVTQTLTDKLNALTDDLNGVKAQVQTLIGQVASLNSSLAALTTRVKNLEDALAALQTALGPLNGLSGNLVSTLTGLQTTVNQLSTLLSGLTPGQLTSALDQLATLQTSVTGLTSQVTLINTGLSTVTTQMGALQLVVTGLGTTVGTLTGGVNTLTGQVGLLQLADSNTQAALTTIGNQISSINGTLTPLNTLVMGTLSPQVTTLNSSVGTLQTQMTAVCNGVTADTSATNSLVNVVKPLPGGGGLTTLSAFSCPS